LDKAIPPIALFDPLKVAWFSIAHDAGRDRRCQVMMGHDKRWVSAGPDDNARRRRIDVVAARSLTRSPAREGNAHWPSRSNARWRRSRARVIATGKGNLDRDDLAALAAEAGRPSSTSTFSG